MTSSYIHDTCYDIRMGIDATRYFDDSDTKDQRNNVDDFNQVLFIKRLNLDALIKLNRKLTNRNQTNKKLTIVRKMPFQGKPFDQHMSESVLLHIDNYKPDVMLLNDRMAFPWIQDYAYALVMISIGQAREKFATIAGPQGGSSLNGAALKSEGQALLDKLDEEIKNFADGGFPLTWIMG